jgi:hypothetical protein
LLDKGASRTTTLTTIYRSRDCNQVINSLFRHYEGHDSLSNTSTGVIPNCASIVILAACVPTGHLLKEDGWDVLGVTMKIPVRLQHFFAFEIGFALGLFGFALALGAPKGRKMGVGLALFGFVWVCFCARKVSVFSVTICRKRG